MIPYILSAAAFLVLSSAAISGYFSYRDKPAPWKKYFVFYTAGMALFQGALFFISYSGGLFPAFREAVVLSTELIQFLITALVLYAFSLCVLQAVNRRPGSKLKLLLIILAGGVLIFGTIVIIWNRRALVAAARHFFYLYLFIFSGLGILRARVLLRDRRKRVLLLLLVIFAVYFLWSIFSSFFIQADSIYVHIGFTLLWGFLAVLFDVFFLLRKRVLGEVNRREFLEDAGVTGQESQIIEMMARGMSNRQIGSYLLLDDKYLDAYIYNIYKKLNVNNRVELFKKLDGR